MKFFAILVLFALLGHIAAFTPSPPRVVYRMDDDSAESDEADDIQGSSEEERSSLVPEPQWSFRRAAAAAEPGWQQHQPINQQFQGGSFQPSPIRRFRDDDSEEEEDDEDDDEFNDDVVDSDISYAAPGTVYRALSPFFGRARAGPMTTTSRRTGPGPVSSSSYPMMPNNRNRYQTYPMYNRMQMNNGAYVRIRPAMSSGSGPNRRVIVPEQEIPYYPFRQRVPQRVSGYPPMRRVNPNMVYPGQSSQRPMMSSRPMTMYNRRQMIPVRPSVSSSSSFNPRIQQREPMYNRRPISNQYSDDHDEIRRNRQVIY